MVLFTDKVSPTFSPIVAVMVAGQVLGTGIFESEAPTYVRDTPREFAAASQTSSPGFIAVGAIANVDEEILSFAMGIGSDQESFGNEINGLIAMHLADYLD